MAVYPGAVNMLIPRGTIGGAGQQPKIKPTIIILHTNASNTSLAGAASLMANTTKGQEYHFQQEAEGSSGRVAGRLGQYVDTVIRADNNYKANSFTVGGVLCGAISVETADHGSPYEKSWTDLGQRRNLEDLVVWLCQTHGIPARRCPNPYAPGIGYHSMWGYNTSSNPNVNPWTNAVGKICPGPGKIREFDDLLAAVARRVAGQAPPPATGRRRVFRDLVDEAGNRFLSDGQTVRWCRTVDAVSYAQSVATAGGNPGVVKVTKAKILDGVYGEFVGQGYPGGPALPTLGSVSQNATMAATQAQAAADISAETLEAVKDISVGGVDVQAIAQAVNDDAAARLAE